MIQASVAYQTIGAQLDYDTLCIFTLTEQDGELRVINVKDFCDPEKRANVYSWAAKAMAEGAPVA